MKSKVIARVAESIYKSICKLSTTEMISVPGDDKLLYMQSMVDKAYGVAGKSNAMVYFVNGDCTKWSASETMESFMCMTEFIMDPKLANICNGVFDLWMKKKIQFPFRIIKNSVAISEHTKYLKLDEKDQSLLSTQNILQGVFNYTSSTKADVINTYAIHIWRRMRPESKLYIEYLVHSDDYVIVCVCDNIADFLLYRKLHKVCMKLGGITDSVKKTNIQYIFMEFISLISFNGSMCYPTIKKTKEITSTLPCESFKSNRVVLM
jgi:hypothetical protein